MNKLTKTIIGFALLAILFIFSCQRKSEIKDTITEGKATVYVDESILPIVEDEVAVFEAEYKAKLHLVSKSETKFIRDRSRFIFCSIKSVLLSRIISSARRYIFPSHFIK